MKNKLLFLLVMISTISLGNCASMFSGTRQYLTLSSNEKGTKFYINEMEVGKDNVTVSQKKGQSLLVRASKKGCTDVSREVDRSFNPATLLGCFVDSGIVSIVVVDWLVTGAIWTYEPSNMVLTPSCDEEKEEKKSKDDEEEEEEKVEKKKKKKTK
ncbi:MAG: hypothetical protein IPL26_14285 [Leptospiraceae bacterium]|nr:hypothetical protein [Leptospiraceae bacterium]